MINEHPNVKESIVVGVAEEVRGEAVTGYVISQDGSLPAREHCSRHPMLARYKKPRYSRFV